MLLDATRPHLSIGRRRQPDFSRCTAPAHAHGAEGADAAVRAGVRSIEHGTYLSDDTLQLMAKQGTFFDPTLDIVNDLAEAGGDYDHAGLKRRGEMMQPILHAAVQRAHRFGVKIVAGSDTGYGPSSIARVSREMGMLVAAGFEAGLLVVDGNPLDHLRTLLDPLLVISNGRIGVDRLNFGTP